MGYTVSEYQGIIYVITSTKEMIHIRALPRYPNSLIKWIFLLHRSAFELGGRASYYMMMTHITLNRNSN